MARFDAILTDQYNRPIGGALITVIAEDGSLAALTYDDGSTLYNPFVTGLTGAYYFNTADAVYHVEYRYGGRLVTERDVIVGKPAAFTGAPGPADNTYTSYSALLASDPTRVSGRLVGDTDVPPEPDGNFSYDGTTWVRQTAQSIAARTDPDAPLQTQADKNALSFHLFDWIPKSLWAGILAGTSNYAADDALDSALTWIGDNAPGARLVVHGFPRLSRAHTLNVNLVTLVCSGSFVAMNLAANTTLFTIRGPSAEQSLVLGTTRTKVVEGLSLVGPGGVPGPNWGNGCTGIRFQDVDNLCIRNLYVTDFATGVTNGDNAYVIELSQGAISRCPVGYYVANATNAGERMVLAGMTLGGCANPIVVYNGFADVFATRCSIDYPAALLSADPANADVRFVLCLAGRLRMTACHFEGGGPVNPMGGLAPFQQGSDDSSLLEIKGSEILFASGFSNNVPVFQNDNAARQMGVEAFMYGGFGYDSDVGAAAASIKSVIATGRIKARLHVARGADAPAFGPTHNGAVLSRSENRIAGLGQIAITTDTQPITSAHAGTNIVLGYTGNVSGAGVPEFYAHKSYGGGSASSFAFIMPIKSGQTAGGELYLSKAGGITGSLTIDALYVSAHREQANAFVVDLSPSGGPIQSGVFAGTQVVDIGGLSATPIRYVFGGFSNRAAPGDTHAIIQINLNNADAAGDPDARLIVSGVCMGEID